MSPAISTPARRSGLEVAEARAPLAEQELAVILDDAADLMEFRLFKTFIAAQSHRLRPEFTGVAGLFNVDMRRFKFICKIEVEPVATFSKHGRHEWIVLKTAGLGLPWKERFRHARVRACFKRRPSIETAGFVGYNGRSTQILFWFWFTQPFFWNGGIESKAAAWSKREFSQRKTKKGAYH